MIKILQILVFICLPLFSNAQENYLLSLEEQEEMPTFPKYFIEKIIDARSDTSKLGNINRYISDRKDKLKFVHGLEKELTIFLGANMKAKQGKLPIILQINDLSLEEFKEHSWVKLSAKFSFFEKRENQIIKHFTADESQFYNLRMVIRKDGYEKMFAEIILKCLKEFSNRLVYNKLFPENVKSLDEIEPEVNDSFRIVKKLTKGIYYSYYDFIYGTIDSTIKFNPTYYKNSFTKNRYWATLSADNMEFKPWGFCDMERVFVLVGNKYYPMQLINNRLVVFENPQDNVALSWSVAMNNIEIRNKEMPFFFNSKKGTLEYLKDTLPDYNQNRIYIFNSYFSKLDSVEVTINDEKTKKLSQGELIILEISNLKENNRLCIKENNNTHCLTVNINQKKSYFMIRKSKDSLPIFNELVKKKDINNAMIDYKKGQYNLICNCFYFSD